MKTHTGFLPGLIALGLISGCGGGDNNAVTTVPTAHLAITLPAGDAKVESPYSITVSALDASNAVVTTYAGTVRITTSDSSATLPTDATLSRGAGNFSVTFKTAGSYTITATDTVGNAIPVTSAAINAIHFLSVGGTITGLTGAGLVLANGADTVSPAAGAASFTFATELVTGSSYAVTVLAQPANQLCGVTNGSGQIGSGAVTDVTVTCGGQWTWVSGAKTVYAQGLYGTQGVAAVGNVPGARSGFVSWTDSAGDLWLFGGISHNRDGGNAGYYNDLWRYSPGSGLWTWVSGSDTRNALGVYGTKGVAAAGNVPGARAGAVSWTDSAGNLWLFGGAGVLPGGIGVLLNDLWRYSPSSGLWTWVSGSNTASAVGVYGTKGVAAAGNVPGARNASVSWMDSAGNLWLFGGNGVVSSVSGGTLNDLWRYSPSSGLWTWISGSNTPDTRGAYGTQGVAAASNVPGSRVGSAPWIDSAGNLWLFGGYGPDAAGNVGVLNDLWRYSPGSGLWTWVSGSDMRDALGVFGTQGVAAPDNVPGASDTSISWTDGAGNMWLFKGNSGNDLWRFSPASGMWTWVSGSTTNGAPGVYGTQGVAAPGNVPGGRLSWGSWIDSAGNLWLFGGFGYDSAGTGGFLNDLWRFSPDGSP